MNRHYKAREDMDIKNEVNALYDEMLTIRRDLHRHPELGLHEVRTSRIIEDRLTELGLEVRRCTETGVIGVLRGGKPGKTLLLRCDIDALPVQEESGVEYASENLGVMHACGHDAHTAIHLTTAKIMVAHRDEIPGTIVFLFQTNEEDAGAELMIEAGAMKDPVPDNVAGFHIWTPLPTGTIGIVNGPIMASSWYFYITIHGRGGHGGAPHKAINPIDTGAHILEAIKTFHTLENDATKPCVISVCQFHCGEKEIIVSDTATMAGSIRCLNEDDATVRKRFKELVEKVCDTYGCTCEVEFKCGNSLLSNDREMADLVRAAAEKVIGKENIIEDGVATMLGDDFAEFSRRKPGVYYFVGTRNEEAGSVYEHHNAHFRIDEKTMPIAVELQIGLIREYFGF